ncbi:hypothetical protein, partial [Aeromicrobium sp.]|uniref:hypothetical protein n=1 Tax=Aeromicrobium sp. TaxID=1871063 RepID=UPI0019A8B345
MTLLLLILLPLGTQSTAGSAAALAAVLFLTMLVSAGMEHSAVILLAVGFLMSPLNDVRPIASLTFMTASDVFLVLGIGLLIPGLVGRKFRPPTAFVVGALGVVAMGLVSSAVNPNAAMSLNSMLRLVVGALTLPVVFMLWRPRREIVVILAAAYVGGNVVNVVAARINGQASDENRYIGLSTHPNILGFCAMLGLALIPFLLQELPRRFSWIVLLAGAI